jgi:hypothetical protein
LRALRREISMNTVPRLFRHFLYDFPLLFRKHSFGLLFRSIGERQPMCSTAELDARNPILRPIAAESAHVTAVRHIGLVTLPGFIRDATEKHVSGNGQLQ